ncbi:MAG: pirin family protein [Alphaproteobacteria bacterium]|nr:pirin family protein [Alphaproteobacteria bacterium]MBU0795782.1 pirin family protein [Alphaproteobacteria bacterium]MBU0886644.1 pirin family protein [Alphaproteobacteria bacterium]MBU1814499.1 pirin family protein [Alphaproteobacteria bacterium]
MSWQPAEEPIPGDKHSCAALETIIVPRARDIGGFSVRRALPSVQRRMVGPFIFLDQMGPAILQPETGIDVRPHPHIGLATVTYLFEGEILHRDSLGSVQPIRPGALNWMTAGRGISHSERTSPEIRAAGGPLFGIQSWVALPEDKEEIAPAFEHYAANQLPTIIGEGKTIRIIAGTLFGAPSPVRTASPLFYADVSMQAGSSYPLDPDYEERAIYITSGEVDIAGDIFGEGRLLVFRPGDRITIKATATARFIALGGTAMEQPRHIWWNFVSSRKDRIEQAKEDWKSGRFALVPGEDEFIPLPEMGG